MTDTNPIELAPEPGWEEAPFFRQHHNPRAFVSGEPDGDRIRTRYYRRRSDGALVGRVWFGPGTEGPPGHAHGGSMAAVLDEGMGAAAWMAGHPVVAAKIEVHYLKMLPLKTLATIEAWVEGVEGRKVAMRGRLLDARGEPFSESTGLFIRLETDQMRRLAESMPALAAALESEAKQRA